MAIREIAEGYELRGHRLRLYPTKEQVDRFEEMQVEMRKAWNLLVGWRRAHLDACVDRAARDGVIGPEPERPEKKIMEDGTEENRERWRLYGELCRERRRRGMEYCIPSRKRSSKGAADMVREESKSGVAGYDFMPLQTNAWEYGALRQFVAASLEREAVCTAHQYQALIKNFLKARRPRPRKENEAMPLQVMSGDCYRREPPKHSIPGKNGRVANATIIFSGMQIRANEPFRRARALRRPDKGPRYMNAPILQGVAITKETDGWYAAVRLVVPVRERASWTIDDAVGVAFGLDTLCATSTGKVFQNLRRHDTTAAVAEQQTLETREWTGSVWKYSNGSTVRISSVSARIQTRLSRSVRQHIESVIMPYLMQYRWVIMAPEGEDDLGEMAMGRQTRLTAERGGYVSAMGLLRAKILQLGPERVRAVEWVDKARTCSRCGVLDANSWRWRVKPHGRCGSCGQVEHRKVNTARNVRAKGLELLGLEASLSNGSTAPKSP